jgi:hypothetical protein
MFIVKKACAVEYCIGRNTAIFSLKRFSLRPKGLRHAQRASQIAQFPPQHHGDL